MESKRVMGCLKHVAFGLPGVLATAGLFGVAVMLLTLAGVGLREWLRDTLPPQWLAGLPADLRADPRTVAMALLGLPGLAMLDLRGAWPGLRSHLQCWHLQRQLRLQHRRLRS